MFYQKKRLSFIFVFLVLSAIILPFIFLKDTYLFHRFGMFAEPMQHKKQYEKFYIFYKKNNTSNFVELKAQNIPINANAFEMQLRKHHYQKKHIDFIAVLNKIIFKKEKLEQYEKLKWKWYHVVNKQDLQNEPDSLCVFSN